MCYNCIFYYFTSSWERQLYNIYSSRCSFEISLCDWSQLTDDDFDWTRHAGSTPTQFSGPTRDHTTGRSTGHYIYAEMSKPRRTGDKARLGSRWITGSPQCSMTMYYHMYGPAIGKLTVYTRQMVNGPLTTLWQRTTEAGNYFVRSNINLASSGTNKPFQVTVLYYISFSRCGSFLSARESQFPSNL